MRKRVVKAIIAIAYVVAVSIMGIGLIWSHPARADDLRIHIETPGHTELPPLGIDAPADPGPPVECNPGPKRQGIDGNEAMVVVAGLVFIVVCLAML